MTVTGHLGYMPDLTKLYERCSFIPYWWVGEGIIKIQYGEKCKGVCNDDILHTSTKEKKRFFNQSSLVFRLLFGGVFKETNIKLFKNGGFQMTGISSEEMARASLSRLIEMNHGRGIWISNCDGGSEGGAVADASTITNLGEHESDCAAGADKSMRPTISNCDGGSEGGAVADASTITNLGEHESDCAAGADKSMLPTISNCDGGSEGEAVANASTITNVEENESSSEILIESIVPQPEPEEPKEPKPYIKKFDICMMNSDYTIGRSIRRDQLYKILVEKYGLWSSFEPTIYQGVNTKFFWNKYRPASAPVGICVCPVPCEGGGSGYGVGNCKKITISPFRTGSIIITGAKHPEQLHDAYNFINTVLQTYADTVLRSDAPQLEPTRVKKTVIPPSSTEGILRQKMRASPRNIVRLPSP
jgi:hypothetical protein